MVLEWIQVWICTAGAAGIFIPKYGNMLKTPFREFRKYKKSCAGLCPTQLIKCFTFVFSCTMYRYKIVFKIVITSSSVSPVVLMLM